MYVCICHSVTDLDIRYAVEDGATTLDALKHKLKVSTCCGRCEDCANKIIRETVFDQFQLHGCKSCIQLAAEQ